MREIKESYKDRMKRCKGNCRNWKRERKGKVRKDKRIKISREKKRTVKKKKIEKERLRKRVVNKGGECGKRGGKRTLENE